MPENVPASFRATSLRFPGLTMWHRSNTARVLCPVTIIATRSGMPRVDHVPDCCWSEVVSEHPRQTCVQTGRGPGPAEVQAGLVLGELANRGVRVNAIELPSCKAAPYPLLVR